MASKNNITITKDSVKTTYRWNGQNDQCEKNDQFEKFNKMDILSLPLKKRKYSTIIGEIDENKIDEIDEIDENKIETDEENEEEGIIGMLYLINFSKSYAMKDKNSQIKCYSKQNFKNTNPKRRKICTNKIEKDLIAYSILSTNKVDYNSLIDKTGFCENYIRKLQRKMLHSTPKLLLRNPITYKFGPIDIHILFDSDNNPLFLKTELSRILEIKGTSLSYWVKKSNAQNIDTSSDFRLMDTCRKLFGGRSSYVLYSVQSVIKIVNEVKKSRQRHNLNNISRLEHLILSYNK